MRDRIGIVVGDRVSLRDSRSAAFEVGRSTLRVRLGLEPERNTASHQLRKVKSKVVGPDRLRTWVDENAE
ncbi:MAG: hypothetical protein RIT45_1795 [Pseudomonadota bacterium]|jgi:hypothetical protein